MKTLDVTDGMFICRVCRAKLLIPLYCTPAAPAAFSALTTVAQYSDGVTLPLLPSRHLVPWGSVRAEDVVCRLDRLGVVLITVAGFYSTQMLPCAATCSPPHAEFAVPFVLLPNCVSAAMILAGVKMGTRPSPYSFAGVGLSCVTMAAYWSSSSDWDLLGFEAAVVALDAIGLYIYATQAGGAATWWGFHEWMHLSVGIGFYLNIYLVSLIADPDRCLR